MRERHGSGRSGWLRAAVLGANDGIISTSSLLIGVAAAGSSQAAIFTAGLAGLAAERRAEAFEDWLEEARATGAVLQGVAEVDLQ